MVNNNPGEKLNGSSETDPSDLFGVQGGGYLKNVPFQNRVCIYARVSKEEGNKEDRRYQEPENQLEPLRHLVEAKGYVVYKEYVDRGSGADPNREQFNEMLHDAMLSRFSKILVWKLDRFSREKMSTVVGRIEKLERRGCGILSLTETWLDTSKDNPMRDVILAVMTWAAAEERRKISERTKAGIARKRAIGQWKGGRPKKKRDPPSTVEEK